MLKLYDPQARLWYVTEYQDVVGAPTWENTSEGRKEVIRSRVKQVLSGEIARHTCSPGDLAVLFGRFRIDTGGMEPPPDEQPEENGNGARGVGVGKYKWDHFYDTLIFGQSGGPDVSRWMRLFGNSNVGYYDLSNMQVSGSLAESWHNRYVYVTVAGFDAEDEDLVRRTLESSHVVYEVGDHPVIGYRGSDLFVEPKLSDFHVPRRQNFCASVQFQGDLTSFHQLDKKMQTRDRERGPGRFVVHVEGWKCGWYY